MFPSFLIMFRESLEISLIIGIIVSYLVKSNQSKYLNVVYIGVCAGAALSIIFGYMFTEFSIGFEGRTEEIFEGVTMLVAAVLLISMIIWMFRSRAVTKKIEEKVAKSVETVNKVGLFSLAMVSVLREGVEIVLFMASVNISLGQSSIFGSLLGMSLAILLGYLIFVLSVKVKLKIFFNASSALLILFAVYLVFEGIVELIGM